MLFKHLLIDAIIVLDGNQPVLRFKVRRNMIWSIAIRLSFY